MPVEEQINERKPFEDFCEGFARAYRSEKSVIPHIFLKPVAGAAVSSRQNIAIDVEKLDRERSNEWLAYVRTSSAKFPDVAKKYRKVLDYCEGVWTSLKD